MNTAIINSLFENPNVLFLTFFVQALPAAAFAYGLAWLIMRPKKDSNISIAIPLHLYGIVTSLVVSAIFRLITVATGAGKIAYQPDASTGMAGFYLIIVPAIIAAVYIKWIKKEKIPDTVKWMLGVGTVFYLIYPVEFINFFLNFCGYIAIPVIIRYAILKKPIQNKWIAVGILIPLFIAFAIQVNKLRDELDKPLNEKYGISSPTYAFGSPILYMAMALSYVILRRENNESENEEENSATDESETVISSNEIYKTIAEEMERKDYQKGLAMKAMAEAKGDKELGKSLYIKFRHDELYSQIEGELTKKRADKLRAKKIAEEQRQAEQEAKNATALKWGLGFCAVVGVIGFASNSENKPAVVTPPAAVATTETPPVSAEPASVPQDVKVDTTKPRYPYSGDKLSLNFQDIPIADITKIIADFSNIKILFSNDANANRRISVRLNDVPWDHALDEILYSNNLILEKSGDTFIVSPSNVSNVVIADTSSRKVGNYTGRKLSLNYDDIPIRDILMVFADFAEFNMLISNDVDVTHKVILRLNNVSWDEALDILLTSNNLAQRKTGNVISILPQEMTFTNGDKYIGGLKNGSPDGKGSYTWANETVKVSFFNKL